MSKERATTIVSPTEQNFNMMYLIFCHPDGRNLLPVYEFDNPADNVLVLVLVRQVEADRDHVSPRLLLRATVRQQACGRRSRFPE